MTVFQTFLVSDDLDGVEEDWPGILPNVPHLIGICVVGFLVVRGEEGQCPPRHVASGVPAVNMTHHLVYDLDTGHGPGCQVSPLKSDFPPLSTG